MTNKIRTEEEILKDFEKLGYYMTIKKEGFFYNGIILDNKYSGEKINISFDLKAYYKESDTIGRSIHMQEHKLLNELFICWGWL